MISKTYLFNQLFSAEDCKYIIEAGKREGLTEGTVGYGAKEHVNEGIRKSKKAFLNIHSDAIKPIADRVRLAILDANENCFFLKLKSVPWLDIALQFTEYDASYEGKYEWHTDNSWVGRGDDRKVSFVMQLSEPESYKGGSLEIEDTYIDPQRFGPPGSAICFPSMFKHRVTKVEEGVRYSLVAWARGPRLS
jgi:PKHD-type hydroxylase